MPSVAATLPELLELRVAEAPNELAYADATARLTYAELAHEAARLAEGMAQEGVKPGDHVALVLAAGVTFPTVFWAAQLLGAVPCAFNPGAPAEVVRRRAERIRPAMVVTESTVAGLRAAPRVCRAAAPEGDALAFLQPTSGTSGEPRVAMVRHRNVMAYLAAIAGATGVHPDDVAVAWVPPWHDLGLVRLVIGALYAGVPCHIIEPAVRTIPHWLRTISSERGTFSGAPDFAYRIAARMVDPADVDLRSLRFSTNGGEPVKQHSMQAFETRFGLGEVILPAYGLAEATLGVTTTRPGERRVVDARGNVSCGRPLPGLEVRAGDDISTPQEILVRGPTVFAGYLDDQSSSRSVLREGWLHTGDAGYLDAEGRLYVLGRRAGLIKRAGATVAPREVEDAALGVRGARGAAAVGLARGGSLTDEVVVLVERDTASESTPATIERDVAAAIRAELGFAPDRVSVVPPRTIPRTPNGKVQHARLRELIAKGAVP